MSNCGMLGKIIDTDKSNKVLVNSLYKPKLLLECRAVWLNIHDMHVKYTTGKLSSPRHYKNRFEVVELEYNDVLPVEID